jgi:hypothetical protein
MALPAADLQSHDPVTLHRIMQGMIGGELRRRYEAPPKLSHALFVLLMQLNEQERKGKGRTVQSRPSARAQGRNKD